MAVAPNEDFVRPACAGGALAGDFGFNDVAAPDNRDVSEVLDLGAREFQANEFSALRMELDGALENVSLVFPLLLSAAKNDRFGRHERLDGLDVHGKPGAPNGLAYL